MKRFLLLAAVWMTLGSGSIVRADLIPEEQADCDGKRAGDACNRGTCLADRCSRLDYANWDRDASAGPPSVEYDCVVCSSEVASADAGAATKPDDSPEPSSESPASSDEEDSKGGGSSSSCTVDFHRSASRFGPWLLALGFALIVGRRRRPS